MKNTLNKLTSGFFAFVGLLLPMSSVFAADTVKLGNKDAWDLFVHGNGEAIAQILTAVKLMLAPDQGGGAFRYLLLFLAIVGFLILAVRAGFDPGRNFLKMFGFIFLIWGVMYTTTGLRANVHVYDRMQNYSNVITDVPAIVAIPASIISQTGEWLTKQLEQNFSIPGSLKVSEGGQFNLFSKVMSDMDSFVISDLNLTNSLKAYTSDCVVPAMALGRVSADDFYRSAELLKTLEKAKSEALLTRFYPMRDSSCEGLKRDPSTADDDLQFDSGLGALMHCSRAYDCLKEDLNNYAQSLLTATNEQWASAGIMVPFEQAMSDALSYASASGGGNPVARYSRPQGVILQKALVGTMSGAFRDAAIRTGNNEVMLATALSQAEQSQKSSWETAAAIFKNMMGYVYLVLQAFILAVIPVVVIGLMIPGLGAKIFSNYFQILVWLTLWSPMLCIVSFLITIFGGAQMHETLHVAGISMANSAVQTEYANNLVIAAQFIGTMVPLITWGLVKGAMAFTEFVSHGIGSSFATQAGAQAATGNVSMGNMSMDNVSMNKYSTSMSSSVGYQPVDAGSSLGKVVMKADTGGSMSTTGGSLVTETKTHSKNKGVTDSEGWNRSIGHGFQENDVAQMQRSADTAYAAIQAAARAFQTAENIANGVYTGKGYTMEDAARFVQQGQHLIQYAEQHARDIETHMGLGTKGGVKMGKKGGGGGGGEGGGGLDFSLESPFDIGAKHSERWGKSDIGIFGGSRIGERAESAGWNQRAGNDQTYNQGDGSNHSGTTAGEIREMVAASRAKLHQVSELTNDVRNRVQALTYTTGAGVTTSRTEVGMDGFWVGSAGYTADGDIATTRARMVERNDEILGRAEGTEHWVGNFQGIYGAGLDEATERVQTTVQGRVDAAPNETTYTARRDARMEQLIETWKSYEASAKLMHDKGAGKQKEYMGLAIDLTDKNNPLRQMAAEQGRGHH